MNELKKPIKIPIEVTVNRGKVLDLQHFFSTLIIRNQVEITRKKLPDYFRKGDNKENWIEILQKEKLKFDREKSNS